MFKIIFGRARSGKTYTLRNCLIEKLQSGSGEVLLIVPEQFSFQSERDIIEELPVEYIKRVKVVSFTRLLDEVGRECGGLAGKRINSGIRTIMVARAIESVAHELIAFSKQADSVGFAKSMADVISEFKQAAVSSQKLLETSNGLPEGRLKWKLHDISLIISAYNGLISNCFIDPADDMTRLCAMLSKNDWFSGKAVFMDSFKGFTGGEIEVIEKIISSASDFTVTLPCDSAEDEDKGAGLFSNVKKTARRLIKLAEKYSVPVETVQLKESRYECEEIGILERELFSSNKVEFEGEGLNIAVCRADYPKDEIKFVASSIKNLVRDEGYRYKDMVVIARDPLKYELAVKTATEKYGIPIHIDAKTKAENLPIMVFAIAAMDAVNFKSEAILRWLRTDICGFTKDEIILLENYVFVWNINGADWKTEWTKSPYGLDKRHPADAGEKLAEIESIRRRVVARLKNFADSFNGSALDMAKALYRLTVDCGAPEHLSEMVRKLDGKGKKYAEILRQSYSAYMNILSDIVECYHEEKMSREMFASAFLTAMSEYDIGTIPLGLDEVTFGSAALMRSSRPKVAFIIGVNQDVFPAIPKNDGLIAVRERRLLIDEMGLDISDRVLDASVDEMFMFYNSVCCASHKVYFTYFLADDTSKKCEKSPYLDRIEKIFPNIKIFCEDGVSRGVENVVSLGTAKDSFADNFFSLDENALSVKKYFEENHPQISEEYSEIALGSEMVLSSENAKKLYKEEVYLSATKVDRFYSCPFSYFCQYGLGASKPKKAEMDALERGSLVHHIMEKMLSCHGKAIDDLSDEELKKFIDDFTDEYISSIGANAIEDYSWNLAVAQIKSLTLTLIREMGHQLADSDFEPDGFEVSLKHDGDIHTVELPLSDGSRVVFGGQVDRVDRLVSKDANYVCVIDYKTGKKKFDVSDVLYGLNMQMLLYLYSAVRGGKYEGDIPAGIMYIPSERLTTKSSGEKISGNKTDHYSGMLLNDTNVLFGLDNSGSGRYIPVKYTKAGNIDSRSSKGVFELEDFQTLFNHAEGRLINMGEKLRRGEISVSPMDSSNGSACKYCDFKGVCGWVDENENPKVPGLGKEEVLRQMKDGE